uniref:LOB domain-containing protein n=1 Tax=Cucumis melo TaxID=3656 RepID=A0A9I9DXQ0_CUCME
MQSPPPPCTVVLSPCAACKILRRKCVDNCILAPYFPPTDPLKFAAVHRIYGAGNVIKFFQELPERVGERMLRAVWYTKRMQESETQSMGALVQYFNFKIK